MINRTDKRVFRWFGHLDRMENVTISKRIYEECMGNPPAGRPRKTWIDSVNDYLKKISLNVG